MMDEHLRDPIRIPEAERRALAAMLRNQEETAENLKKRREARTPLPDGYTAIGTVVHPGGSQQTFAMTVRDISRGGLSFLYGGFVHLASKCEVVFHAPDRSVVAHARGKVVRCIHLKGPVHEVGVQCDPPIALEDILCARDRVRKYGPCIGLVTRLIVLMEADAPVEPVDQIVGELRGVIARMREGGPLKKAG